MIKSFSTINSIIKSWTKKSTGKFDEIFSNEKYWLVNLTSKFFIKFIFLCWYHEVLIFDRIKYLEIFQKMEKNLRNINDIWKRFWLHCVEQQATVVVE